MLVIGHRGCGTLYPENTIEAVKQAIALNLDGIEIDLQLTKDCEVIVHHDNQIENLEIRNNILSNLKVSRPELPTLKKVLQLVSSSAPSQFNLLLEMKSSHLKDIKEVEALVFETINNLQEYCENWEFVHILSFDTRALKFVNIHSPTLKTCLLIEGCANISHININKLPLYAIGPSVEHITPEVVELAHALNLKVFVWTVKDKQALLQLHEIGVDLIISDCP
jgi:glycerophosphoryl diester phosphodiesterase